MKIISKKEAIEQGLTQYFTGKPCKHNHIAPRKVNKSDCLECLKMRSNKFYANNKDKAKKYYQDNKEHRQEYLKNYYKENKDTILDTSKKRWIDKKEEIKEYKIEYTKKNKDKINDYFKELSKTSHRKLQRRVAGNKRTALKKSTDDGTVTVEAIKEMMIEQGGVCVICKCDIENNYHIDHIRPLAKKGIHSISNIQLLCPFCNISKSDNYDG